MTTTTEKPKLRGQQYEYSPPALELVPSDQRPHTLCAHCPDAIWFRRTEWHCFCDTMKNLSHQPSMHPVTICDGRERAITRLAEIERGR
jgi:hypothetical protein